MALPLMRNNILREDLDAVIDHLKQEDPILTNGPIVRAFEREWSDWLGVKYSVFVNSGASSNLLSLAILRIRYPEGGEVIVPPLTWVSDIASVIQNGFQPVFADIDPRTLAMAPSNILDCISSKTRAVFLTHAQGFDGFTDELLHALEELGVSLIEDVCESHGATHNRQKLGSFGWISNFSFYYAHHMSTIEGGMICTNDPVVYQQARMLRSHGMVREVDDSEFRAGFRLENPSLHPDFIFAFPAYNARNTEIGGILGRKQLTRLDQNVRIRSGNLDQFLSQINPAVFRVDFKTEGSSNYAFNLVLNNPDAAFAERIMTRLRDARVEFRRGSAGGGNQLRQPYLRKLFPDMYYLNFPEVEHIHFFGFYIGNYPSLEKSEIDTLCKLLNTA